MEKNKKSNKLGKIIVADLEKQLRAMESSLTIYDACLKYPDSLSRAFKIPNKGQGIYFMVNTHPQEGSFNSENGLKNIGPCIKFIPGEAIYRTQITSISVKDDIKAISFKEYLEEVEASILAIKKSSRTLQQKKELLDGYRDWLGFKTY